MTFKVIYAVRVKVTWNLKFQKWRFQILSLHHFSTNQKNSNGFWYYSKISKIPWAGFLNFLLVIESRDVKLCQKNQQKFLSSDLNETWYDVRGRWDIHNDMTFKVIRVKVRRWPQSPLGTILTYPTYIWCSLWEWPVQISPTSLASEN